MDYEEYVRREIDPIVRRFEELIRDGVVVPDVVYSHAELDTLLGGRFDTGRYALDHCGLLVTSSYIPTPSYRIPRMTVAQVEEVLTRTRGVLGYVTSLLAHQETQGLDVPGLTATITAMASSTPRDGLRLYGTFLLELFDCLGPAGGATRNRELESLPTRLSTLSDTAVQRFDPAVTAAELSAVLNALGNRDWRTTVRAIDRHYDGALRRLTKIGYGERLMSAVKSWNCELATDWGMDHG